MKLYTTLLLIFTVSISTLSISAEQKWTSYTTGIENCDTIHSIAFQEDYLWCATNGGVVRWNTKDMTYTVFLAEEINNDYNKFFYVVVTPDGNVWTKLYSVDFERLPISEFIFLCFDGETWTELFPENDFANTILKAQEVLERIIEGENAYFAEYGEYLDFDFGDDCPEIGFTQPPESPVVYGFVEDMAIVYENVDLNGDGDIDDGLTLSVDDMQGVTTGSDFTWVTEEDIGITNSSYISRINFGPEGETWFGTRNGLYRYDGETWSFYNEDDGLAGDNITIIAFDAEGAVLATVYEEYVTGASRIIELCRFKNETWTTLFTADDIQVGNTITRVVLGPDGSLWAGGSSGGLSHYSEGTWNVVRELNPEAEFWVILNQVNRTLIGILSSEFSYNFDNGRYVDFDFNEDCPEINFTQSENNLFEFAFMDNKALAREKIDVNGDGDTEDGLTYSVDRKYGTIPGSNITWDDVLISSTEYIRPYLFDFNGVLWGKTYNGIFRYDSETWTEFTEDDGLPSRPVWDIAINPDGTIWAGTQGGGIARFNPSTGVEKYDSLPLEFAITGNYPNPFNPQTSIQFTLPENGTVNLVIYDIMGQRVRTLLEVSMTAGRHTVRWDGRNDLGQDVASGVYIVELKAGAKVVNHRMMLIK